MSKEEIERSKSPEPDHRHAHGHRTTTSHIGKTVGILGVFVAAALVLFLLLFLIARIPGLATPVSGYDRHTFLLIGGEDGRGVEWWSPNSNLTSKRRKLPPRMAVVGLSGHSADLLPGPRVLICGGREEGSPHSLDRCGVINPRGPFLRWEATLSLLSARAYHATASLPGGVLLCGGETGTGWSSDCFRYSNRLWTPAAPMLRPRAQFAMATVEDKVYACGGGNSMGPCLSCESTASCERYDLASDSWSQIAPMPGGPRQGLTLSLANGSLVAVGGYFLDNSKRVPLDRVEVLNPASGLWSLGPSLPNPRMSHSALSINGSIWLLGGEGQKKEVAILAPGAKEWKRWDKPLDIPFIHGAVVYLP